MASSLFGRVSVSRNGFDATGAQNLKRQITTTYLEMASESEVRPLGRQRRLDARLVRAPCPELNRLLYVAVGRDWWWHARLQWDREQWLAWIDRPEVETWIGYASGRPAGYFELESKRTAQVNEVQLAYFGLLPSFIGQGVGAELLSAAVDRAWELRPRRVWVHTCSLDHPHALPNYVARGFKIYRSEETVVDLPDSPTRPGLGGPGRDEPPRL